ncbi:hypothetical protein SAMN05216565_101224 [Litchfieldia salsa]|uniref:Uncharacterized protein n=1 Tax=Litchfieldia salsa TaxID=930152 RepID=A0A1H0PA36_9BACI|nr:hypothetical protein SAMN05216565_101224 [Litchfieldia salsa]
MVGYLIFAIVVFLFMEYALDESRPAIVTEEVQSSQPNEKPEDTVEKNPEPITLKGGIGDPMDFIRAEGKEEGNEYSQGSLHTPLFKMQCMQTDRQLCLGATLYFDDGIETHEQAFEHLKEHLPIDMEVSETVSKKDGAVVVYNLKSTLLYESLRPWYEGDGIEPKTFYVSFRVNSEKNVFAAVIKIGEEEFHND